MRWILCKLTFLLLLIRYPGAFLSGRIKFKKTTWFLGSKFIVDNGNTVSLDNAYVSRSEFVCHGESNSIECQGEVYKSKIVIAGKGNHIIIAEGTNIQNSVITLRAQNSRIIIGKNTRIGSLYAVCMGRDNHILIGESCMISDNVEIWSTDGHAILARGTGDILNPSLPVTIGNEVWIGKNSVILKGVDVKDGTIVGMNSVVTKNTKPFSVVAGNPARIIRENVSWSAYYTKY